MHTIIAIICFLAGIISFPVIIGAGFLMSRQLRAILNLQYTNHRDVWEKDGRPWAHYLCPDESLTAKPDYAVTKIWPQLVTKDPDWLSTPEERQVLRAYRQAFVLLAVASAWLLVSALLFVWSV